MTSFLFWRFVSMIVVLFIIVSLTFVMAKKLPGGPFDRERSLPVSIEKNLRAKYHLDEPLLKQYERYMLDLVKGDLGPSFKYRNRRVTEIIAETFPVSLMLGSLALFFALALGISAGILGAVRQNSRVDYAAMFIAMTGISIPNFVLGPLLLIVFVFIMKIFPVGGWGTPSRMILPALTLGAPYAAYIARLTRGGMLEVIRADFIRTARSKGLPEKKVILKHALKAGVLPVVSFLGPASAGILTGSIVVERIFNIPGIGAFFVNSVLNRDFTMMLGTVILYSVLLVSVNLAVDLIYGILDPRIQLAD